MTRIDNTRHIKAAHGTTLSAKSWLTEAPLRMLMNNLDPEVAERPQELVVYGGIGRAARNWACFDAIVAALRVIATGGAERTYAPHGTERYIYPAPAEEMAELVEEAIHRRADARTRA